jgi:hypothetical protein
VSNKEVAREEMNSEEISCIEGKPKINRRNGRGMRNIDELGYGARGY